MPGGVNNVSMVNGVNPIDPVGQAIAEQQAQRQQQLADTLRQQSLQPIHVDSGNISWSQGLAQLAQGIAANHINRRAMAMQYQAATQAANAVTQATTPKGQVANLQYDPNSNPYSGNGQHRNLIQKLGDFIGGGAPVGRVGTAQPANAAPVQNAPMAVAPMAAAPVQGGSIPASNNAPLPVNQGAGPTPTVGQPPTSQMGVVSSPAPPPSGAVMGTGSLSMSGDPMQDNINYRLDPKHFIEKRIDNMAAASALTPVEIALRHAGMDPASPEYQGAMNAAAQGAAYGGVETDRRGFRTVHNTGQVVGYSPNLDAGQVPVGGPNGSVVGASTLPGYAQSKEEIAASQAKGSAQGDLISLGTDTNGRPIYGRKSDQLNGNGAPSAASGSLNDYYHNRNAPPGSSVPGAPPQTLSPQARGAQEQSGKNSADSYNRVIQQGEGKNETVQALQMIKDLGKNTNTGPGATWSAALGGGINRITRGAGFGDVYDDGHVARVQEITKLVSNLGLQNGGGGKNGATDARLKTALDSLPDPEKAPAALQVIAPYLAAKAASDKAQGLAGAHYMQTYGGETFPKFSADWSRNNDPRIWQWMQEGPQGVVNHMRQLSPSERNVVAGKYQALKAMGAF